MTASYLGLDLRDGLAHAKTAAAEALGTDRGIVTVWSPLAGRLDVMESSGVAQGLVEALAGAGALVARSLRRDGVPSELVVSELGEADAALRRALDAHAVRALLVLPLLGEGGVAGSILVPTETPLPAALSGTWWGATARVLAGVQLAAATAALRIALATDRRGQAHAFDGMLAADGPTGRIVLVDGSLATPQAWGHLDPLVTRLVDVPGLSGIEDGPESDALGLDWHERDVKQGVAARRVAIATVRLQPAAATHPTAGGRIVLVRDASPAGARPAASVDERLLALALRVAHTADELTHALRLERPGRGDTSAVSLLEPVAQDAVRVAERALHRCRSGDEGDLIEPGSVVTEVLARYAPDFALEGVRPITLLPDDLPNVPGDRLELLRAVRALVRMARRSLSPNGGVLTARTWADDEWVYISVSDQPEGLSAAAEPRAHHAHDDAEAEVARRILERRGGRLVTDRRPGVASRATIMLRQERRRERRVPTPVAPPRALAVEPRPIPLQVLIVDDNPALRSVLKRYLERRGHVVTEASDGEEGLRLLQGRAFDRLVLDIQMPHKDGVELFTELGGVDPALQARTIFITGGVLEPRAEKVIRDAGCQTVRKPFDLAEMTKRVESCA